MPKRITTAQPGLEGVTPKVIYIDASDDILSTVMESGYLTDTAASEYALSPNMMALVSFSDGEGGIETGWLSLSFGANNVITLVAPSADIPDYVEGIVLGKSEPNKVLTTSSTDSLNGNPMSWYRASSYISHDQVIFVSNDTPVPATGSCTVKIRLLDYDNNPINYLTWFKCYVSTSSGVLSTAVTSLSTATTGVGVEIVTGRILEGTTDINGVFDVTLTGSAGTYYLSVVLPNGHRFTTTSLVVN